MRGIEPRTFHMQSERSTTELHPPPISFPKGLNNINTYKNIDFFVIQKRKKITPRQYTLQISYTMFKDIQPSLL